MRAARRASRRNSGGWSGRSLAVPRVARTGPRPDASSPIQHGKLARARRDYHHKRALALVRDNRAVSVGDLHVAGMERNHRLARDLRDAGLGQLVRLLGEKAERYGRTLHKIVRSDWRPSGGAGTGMP